MLLLTQPGKTDQRERRLKSGFRRAAKDGRRAIRMTVDADQSAISGPRVLRAQAGLEIVDDEYAILASSRQESRENTAERRRLLGEFIRSRRERTTPDMVGMPPGLRRRTPGLRREEVALLSGIGITWYTWLEQGRPINVSGQVGRDSLSWPR
jgi:hypothetical protein